MVVTLLVANGCEHAAGVLRKTQEEAGTARSHVNSAASPILSDLSVSVRYAIIYAGVLMAAAVVLGVFVLWARRRMLSARQVSQGQSGKGFTIENLEALRRDGQISDEEFSRLRRVALGLGEAGDKSNTCPSSPPLKGDDGTVSD